MQVSYFDKEFLLNLTGASFIGLSFLCSLDATGREAKAEVRCLTHQVDIKRIPLEGQS